MSNKTNKNTVVPAPPQTISDPENELTELDVLAQAEAELFCTDPKAVAKDVIVNTSDKHLTLPRVQEGKGYSTVTIRKGDRLKGSYYREMVTVHRVAGLQLACLLTEDHLKKLEDTRLARVNRTDDPWTQFVIAERAKEAVAV